MVAQCNPGRGGSFSGAGHTVLWTADIQFHHVTKRRRPLNYQTFFIFQSFPQIITKKTKPYNIAWFLWLLLGLHEVEDFIVLANKIT